MAKGYRVNQFGGPEVMVWEALNLLLWRRARSACESVPVASTSLKPHARWRLQWAGTALRDGHGSGRHRRAGGRRGSEFTAGDRVFGRVRGAHAEVVDCDPEHLMLLPDNLSFEQGAAIPVGWLTAWHALYTVGGMQAGDRVLIEAVGGSVGSAALALAKQAGCWTLGTASRDDKLAQASTMGCDATVNYRNQSVSDQVSSLTGGEGMDIGLMTIGDATADELIDSMGMDGRVVMFGSTGGRDITFNLRIGILNIQLLSMSISTNTTFTTHTMPISGRRPCRSLLTSWSPWWIPCCLCLSSCRHTRWWMSGPTLER